ncbi:MAG: hypothetical protein IJ150_07800 [Bacteroidales bacterium]|nr:hypothetical protein [Bacteroidales bacterium]
MNLKKILIILTVLFVSFDVKADIKLPHIISDRMVLQQKTLCNLWGKSDPFEEITVKASWDAEATTKADNFGNWSVKLQTPKAGGSFFIDFIGKNHIRVNDILIGEVWIASGASNMEMPLAGWPPHDMVVGGLQAIEQCNHEDIRITIIEHKPSFNKEDDAGCRWYKCSPDGGANISALAYFFAKKIHDGLGNIPVGIVLTCWTGSNAECWADLEVLKLIPSLKDQISEFERCKPLQDNLNNWIRGHRRIILNNDWAHAFENVDFLDKDVCRLSFDDSEWKSMELPCYMDNPDGIGAFDGIVWFRKWVNIPLEWTNKKLILSLGPIDDRDVTFVNGEKVGETLMDGAWNLERKYEIPQSVIRGNDLLIAVRVIDGGNGGGICGVRELMCIYPEDEPSKAISIAGDWKYLPTAELFNDSYFSLDYKTMEFYKRPNVPTSLNMKTISALYNSMIYPIIKFSSAGIIFSHGESNVGRSEEYMKLLPILVENWRKTAGNPDLKFYYVQSAPNAVQEEGAEQMREAQRRLQNVIPNSAMVTEMDLGRFSSIHTLDKKKTADRLAAVAFNDLYGKPQETSGPEFVSMSISKNKITLSFSHVGGGLVCQGKRLTDFEVLDSKGNVYEAEAEIQGDKIVVSSSECPSPKNVRYAYRNWVQKPTLYNKEGFAASSFTTEKKFTDYK